MNFNNIEDIIININKKVKSVESIRKWDGISLEITAKKSSRYNQEDFTNKLDKLFHDMELLPYQIELNPNTDNTFLVQFPDFTPVYTEEQIHKMYNDLFEFLLKSYTSHSGVDKSTTHLLKAQEQIVRLAIKSFYASNTNRYRVKEIDMLNDVELRLKLNKFFKDAVYNFSRKDDDNVN